MDMEYRWWPVLVYYETLETRSILRQMARLRNEMSVMIYQLLCPRAADINPPKRGPIRDLPCTFLTMSLFNLSPVSCLLPPDPSRQLLEELAFVINRYQAVLRITVYFITSRIFRGSLHGIIEVCWTIKRFNKLAIRFLGDIELGAEACSNELGA